MITKTSEVITIPEAVLIECLKKSPGVKDGWQKTEGFYNKSASKYVKIATLYTIVDYVIRHANQDKLGKLIDAITSAITDQSMQVEWQKILQEKRLKNPEGQVKPPIDLNAEKHILQQQALTVENPKKMEISDEILTGCVKKGSDIREWRQQEFFYNQSMAANKKLALPSMAFYIALNTDPNKNDALINAVTQAITDPIMQTEWQRCLQLPFFLASKKTHPAAETLNKEIPIDFEPFEPFEPFEQVINKSSRYLPTETRDIIDRLTDKEPRKEQTIIKKMNAFISSANETETDDVLDKVINKIYEDLGKIFGEDIFKQELLTALKALTKNLPPEAATAISGLIKESDLEKIHNLIVAINIFKKNTNDNKIGTLYEQINEIIGKDAFKEQLWSLLEKQIEATEDSLKNLSQPQTAILENIKNTINTVHTATKTIHAGDLKIIQKAIDLIKDFNGYIEDEDNDLDLNLDHLKQDINELFNRWIPKQAEEARQPVDEAVIEPLVTNNPLNTEPQESQHLDGQYVLDQILEKSTLKIETEAEEQPAEEETEEKEPDKEEELPHEDLVVMDPLPAINPEHAVVEISQKYQKKPVITAEASTGRTNTDISHFRQMSYTTLNKAQELMALIGKDEIFNKIKEVQNNLGKKFVRPESNDFINIFKQLELACMKTSVDLKRGIHKKTSDTYLQAYQDKVKNIIDADIARNRELFNEATEFYFYMYSIGMPSYGYSPPNDEKKIKRVCNNLHTIDEWNNQKPIKIEFAADDADSKPSSDIYMQLQHGIKKLTMDLPQNNKSADDSVKKDIVKFITISIEQLGDYSGIIWKNMDKEYQPIAEGMCFANWKRATFNDSGNPTPLSNCMPSIPWDWAGWIKAINKDHPDKCDAITDELFKKISDPGLENNNKALEDCLYALATYPDKDKDSEVIKSAFIKGYEILSKISNYKSDGLKSAVIKDFVALNTNKKTMHNM